MNKIARRMKLKEMIKKRLLSAVLILALVATMVSVAPPDNSVSVAEAEEGESSGGLVRGVVNSIDDLPQSKYGVNNYYHIERGTAERPFVALEIVPYEEYAEFGYLISGCEPIRVEDLNGSVDVKTAAELISASYMNNQSWVFFKDEPAANLITDHKWENTYNGPIKGYYERVEDGTGTFIQVPDTSVAKTKMSSQNNVSSPAPTSDSLDSNILTGEAENSNNSPLNTPEIENSVTEDDKDIVSDNPEESENQNAREEDEEQKIEKDGEEQTTEENDEKQNSEVNSVNDQGQNNKEDVKAQNIEGEDTDGEDTDGEDVVDGNSGLSTASLSDNNIMLVSEINGGESATPSDESNDTTAPDEGNDTTAPDGGDETTPSDETVSPGDAGTPSPEPPKTYKLEKAPDGEGNIIWHTIWPYEELDCKNEGIQFDGDITSTVLANVGDRLYTERYTTEQVWYTNLYDYRNPDYFLCDSLGYTKEEADNFSIVVKTITPSELNNCREWIQYADLIIISPKSHNTAAVDVWKKKDSNDNYYNRLNHEPTSKDGSYASNQIENDDLDWNTILDIYYKVTADTNFAAIILDDNFFNPGQFLTSKTQAHVDIDVYNFNLKHAINNSGNPLIYGTTGSNNNFYKLYVMLMCMDSYFFKQIYLSGGDDAIVRDGVNDLQSNAAMTYWCVETFMLAPDNWYTTPNQWGGNYTDIQSYWNEKMWDGYGYAATNSTTTNKNWCNGHIFTYKGDNSVGMTFTSSTFGDDSYWNKFKDFRDWADDQGLGNKVQPTDAVRYILGEYGKSGTYGQDMSLSVLDLEPSVDVDANGTPEWYLTETYIRMLLPNFRGDVEIKHQTTAEFIGKVEDLNSTYQVIFMGLDTGAYNLASKQIQLNNWNWLTLTLPDWNDNSLDGKIYLHTGDRVTHDNLGYGNVTTRSSNWLYGKGNITTVRFAGNDISKLKLTELNEFIDAGYVVIAEEYLYNLESAMIADDTNISTFISQAKAAGKPVFKTTDFYYIDERVSDNLSNIQPVIFERLPAIYNGVDTVDGNNRVQIEKETANYLPVNPNGKRRLDFELTIPNDGYEYVCVVYVDQDGDSKFEYGNYPAKPTEVKEVRSFYGGSHAFSVEIEDTIGAVHWKIEVLRSGTEIRYSRTGISAVPATSSSAKEDVRVLQIMPDVVTSYDAVGEANYKGGLDLTNTKNDLFEKYYSNLPDYNITIDSITLAQYESFFYTTGWGGSTADLGFRYEYTGNDAEGNPVKEPKNLDKVENRELTLNGKKIKLSNYNMFIIGFGDTYGGKNLSNTYGAVDYIQYFASQGKSILFCHDLTSFYNSNATVYGSTANTLLRDLMGMNRYGSISSLNLYGSDTARSNKERAYLQQYQAVNSEKYDTTYADEIHGYTLYAIKRMKSKSDASNQMIFKHLNFANDDNGNYTTKASLLNEGQVTRYPYLIGHEITNEDGSTSILTDYLSISETHGQYYQLSPEDKNVTVWYTLTGENDTSNYTVSPNDAMNNYYIYSKGNIFYSGVGHTTVKGDMEAKLFVNTMIAAYNAAAAPPVILVDNEEAVLTSTRSYSIEIMQDYDDLIDGFYTNSTPPATYGLLDSSDDTYDVFFTPVDYNASSAELKCRIQLEDGSYFVNTIYEVRVNADGSRSLGTPVTKNGSNEFTGLKSNQLYYLAYPKRYINGNMDERIIVFTTKNDLVEEWIRTELKFSIQPLFPLD